MKKEQSVESHIGTFKKEQSLKTLAIGASGSKNVIEVFEEETKSRKSCEWRDLCKQAIEIFEEGTK